MPDEGLSQLSADSATAPGSRSVPGRLLHYLRAWLFWFALAYSYGYLLLGGYVLVAGVLLQASRMDLSGRPAGADFITFRAAAELARQGVPAAAYSLETIHHQEEKIIRGPVPPKAWNYPPTFLLLLLPLAYLPYLLSVFLWLGVTLSGYLWVMRRVAPFSLSTWIFLAFPGSAANFLYGQNGYFSVVLMGGGVLLLESRPFLGGAVLGLLSYKPQLALVLPLALLAGGYWRALGGAAAGAGGLALAAAAFFGFDTWRAFFYNLPFAASFLDSPSHWSKMTTVYAAGRLLGLGPGTAWAAQGLSALAAAGAAAWVWRRRGPLALRGSTLALATLLAGAYAFEYDLALLALPFAWLGHEEYTRRRDRGLTLLVLSWVILTLMALTPLSSRYPLTPAILGGLLVFATYRAGAGWSG